MGLEEDIRTRFDLVAGTLNERQRRLMAAAEAKVIGHGGIQAVSKATGVSRPAISRGLQELSGGAREISLPPGRVRRPGGGRKAVTETDPTLLWDLERLVAPVTRGDPESPLLWTCKSARKISRELGAMGHRLCPTVACRLLRSLGYSLQANRKTKEGGGHPDRDAQFRAINETVKAFQAEGQPVISIDAKKKELVGDFKNAGKEWRQKGEPDEVRVYDFVDKDLGRATPFGIYDVTRNQGFVNVGIDHDTAEFAVQSIRRWWTGIGQPLYPKATRLLITADGGGSNGVRVRLWKTALQTLCDETGLCITVCHLPPGTSKWNKIEHKMFSFISQNWRGKPLRSFEIIVRLIGATTTKAGLTIRCVLDDRLYPKGIKVSDEQLQAVNLQRHDFHGDWNYTIHPHQCN
jgi:hypothetical protein